MDEPHTPTGPVPRSTPVKIQSLNRHTESVGIPLPVPVVIPSPVEEEPTPLYIAPEQVEVNSQLYGRSAGYEPAPSRSGFLHYWSAIGGGSLIASLAIHAGLLVGAYFVVQQIVIPEKPVDFLPGGGNKEAAQASQSLNQQVQTKRRSSMDQSMASKRIVVEKANAAMVLQDLPMDGAIDVPDVTEKLLGGKNMSAGFSAGGFGGGSGKGVGPGSVNAFLASTFFGKLGGDGLPGTFYDLKQDQDKHPIPYDPQHYAGILKKAADKRFAPSAMQNYYRAAQQMSFTFLAIPYMSAEEGPKAFNVEKEVQPRGWFVHYSGHIIAPYPGEWRFVGNFDDALVVYINNKPVFDGSWLNIANHEEKEPDKDLRQNFGGPPVLTEKTRAFAGKWVKLDGTTKIDIIVGERPGGRVGGLLLVQHKKTDYKKRPDGSPILPVFTTTKPDMADITRMKEFARTAPAFELELDDIPVFELKKSAFEMNRRNR